MLDLLKLIAVILLIAGTVKGFKDLWYLLVNIEWLKKQNIYFNKKSATGISRLPFFYILMPVLREQKILESTIKNFLDINYPKTKFQIIIITTEKEIHEKEINRFKIKQIAEDLSIGIKYGRFVEKYIGIFNELKLGHIHRKYVNKKNIYNEILDEFDEYEDTITLADKIINKYNHKYNVEILSKIHYPLKTGVMAHQINYASEKLINRNPNNEKKYIAIYNADSSVNKNTLKIAAEIIQKNKKENFVIQQSAIFLRNYKQLGYKFKAMILKAAGIFQTNWTINTEIARIRSQNKKIRYKKFNKLLNLIFNLKLAHCVGHGLIIRLGLFKQLNYFSTETLNEDLPFGFMLCAKGIPIIPLPVLESADTPSTLSGLINQKKIWYHSYLEYYKCRNQLIRIGINRKIVNILYIQSIIYGLVWLFNSIIFFLPLFIGFLLFNKIIIFSSVLILAILVFIPYLLILINLKKLYYFADDNNPKILIYEYILVPLSGLFILFTDSLGPLLAVFQEIQSFFTGKNIYKQKTER